MKGLYYNAVVAVLAMADLFRLGSEEPSVLNPPKNEEGPRITYDGSYRYEVGPDGELVCTGRPHDAPEPLRIITLETNPELF